MGDKILTKLISHTYLNINGFFVINGFAAKVELGIVTQMKYNRYATLTESGYTDVITPF